MEQQALQFRVFNSVRVVEFRHDRISCQAHCTDKHAPPITQHVPNEITMDTMAVNASLGHVMTIHVASPSTATMASHSIVNANAFLMSLYLRLNVTQCSQH